MQQVNGVPVYSTDPRYLYSGLDKEPTWFSAQGGVYKCIELSTNKAVAIKKYLVEEESRYPDMFVMPKELVENEIYSMTKCLHENILKLYAVHLHQEFVYLVMPLCTGGSLQQYVFDHHLTVGQLVHIITSVAAGLAKVHGNGYIHRDIKCDNIFLDQENNTIVLGDFGVVSISPAADSSIEEAGVVLFWSPELVMQKIVNHKIDIWALGIVILEVLNGGKAPYEDEKLDEDQIKERILLVGRPEYPSNLPSLLVDLLDHCLDPDPHTRYSANNVLQHPFLKNYEPELLFPATPLDHEVSSEASESMRIIKMQDIQPFDNTTMVESKRATTPIKAKCRLPLPAFSVDKRLSAAVPVKEKIANVIRKRQTMSDANRSQGSRIPMLCILQPRIEHLPDDRPKLRSVKSVKLNDIEKQKRPKTLTRSKTMPSLKEPPAPSSTKRASPTNRAPLTEIKTNTIKPVTPPTSNTKKAPQKTSLFRKRLPTGESRTARLTMGLSTNARRQSYKERDSTESSQPTLAYYNGTKPKSPVSRSPPLKSPTTSNNNKPASSITTTKKRPMSFASTSNNYNHKKPIPEKRQSVPPTDKKKSLKSNIKAALRVH